MVYLMIVIIVVVMIIILIKTAVKPNRQSLDQTEMTQTGKPVILLIVDSLMNEPLQQAVKKTVRRRFNF